MDLNVQAFRIVEEATDSDPSKKNRKAASRKGGLIGGTARAKSMAPAQRLEIARKASAVRWNKSVPA